MRGASGSVAEATHASGPDVIVLPREKPSESDSKREATGGGESVTNGNRRRLGSGFPLPVGTGPVWAGTKPAQIQNSNSNFKK